MINILSSVSKKKQILNDDISYERVCCRVICEVSSLDEIVWQYRKWDTSKMTFANSLRDI